MYDEDEYEPGDRHPCQIIGGPAHRDDGNGHCLDCGATIEYWCTGCGQTLTEPFAEHAPKCRGESPERRGT